MQGLRRVAVVAHSMGNRALTRCMVDGSRLCASLLQRIVFAAPDVAQPVFMDRAVHFANVCASMATSPLLTLYRNSYDKVETRTMRVASPHPHLTGQQHRTHNSALSTVLKACRYEVNCLHL